ncbi:MAG: hypothetical protein Ct9H300mP1_02530 [Planctomycetaceae bacterium]|nr:MAG: hypothetical protein Ct9H300mP1_02530 [Planctomycetaceae bacterium]
MSRAVSACRYPPAGERGFGPLRPLDYGRKNAVEFCDDADENIIVVVQIEQAEAVENIDEIVAVEGLTSLAFGPMDLSAHWAIAANRATRPSRKRSSTWSNGPKGPGVATGSRSVPTGIGRPVGRLRAGLDLLRRDVTLMIQCFNKSPPTSAVTSTDLPPDPRKQPCPPIAHCSLRPGTSRRSSAIGWALGRSQRAMVHEGHLLLVLHGPPSDDHAVPGAPFSGGVPMGHGPPPQPENPATHSTPTWPNSRNSLPRSTNGPLRRKRQ